MRIEFHADLAECRELLVAMANEVRDAMRRATTSLLEADAGLAEGVIVGDAAVNQLRHAIEEKVYAVLARQAPVASDLRMVITALHIAVDLERMGDMAKHVAKTALRRAPVRAVPDELTGEVKDMAAIADRIAGKIEQVITHPQSVSGLDLEREDDAMDALHRGLFEVLVGQSWTHGVEPAIDAAQLGRFYERYADHAVNAGHQMSFFVSGEALP